MTIGRRLRSLSLLLLAGLAGCTSLGPLSVPRDRVDYLTAIASSWKKQTLLNIVRLRYGDAPTFLDVSSVISAYAFQGQLAAGGQIASGATATVPSGIATFGGTATYVDRPTITYAPLTGDKFARSLLRPIPPSAVFELIQAGFPADRVLQLTTRAINGIYNRSTIGSHVQSADPAFYPLIAALRRLQLSGAVTLRLKRHGTAQVGSLIFAPRPDPEVDRDLRYVERTLRLSPNRKGEFTLVFGALPRGKNEIALLTQSMLEILMQVASGVEVPKRDVTDGAASPSTRELRATSPWDRPIIRIKSGPKAPADAFAAVTYRGTSYWIDNNDLASKGTFTFLMLFFSLAETGVTQQAPVLTLPVN